MKTKLLYDDEFNEYYFQLFGKDSDYIWISQLMKDNKDNLIAITERGFIIVNKIDYENNIVCIG